MSKAKSDFNYMKFSLFASKYAFTSGNIDDLKKLHEYYNEYLAPYFDFIEDNDGTSKVKRKKTPQDTALAVDDLEDFNEAKHKTYVFNCPHQQNSVIKSGTNSIRNELNTYLERRKQNFKLLEGKPVGDGRENDPNVLLCRLLFDITNEIDSYAVSGNEISLHEALIRLRSLDKFLAAIWRNENLFTFEPNVYTSLRMTAFRIGYYIPAMIIRIEQERNQIHSEGHLTSLCQSLEGVIDSTCQYLFYALNDAKEVSDKISVIQLQSPVTEEMRLRARTRAGILLYELIHSKSVTSVFPSPKNNNDKVEKSKDDNNLFLVKPGNKSYYAHLFQKDIPINSIWKDFQNLPLGFSQEFLKEPIILAFIKLHGLVQELCHVMGNLKKARQLAGLGGDIAIFVIKRQETLGLLQSIKTIKDRILENIEIIENAEKENTTKYIEDKKMFPCNISARSLARLKSMEITEQFKSITRHANNFYCEIECTSPQDLIQKVQLHIKDFDNMYTNTINRLESYNLFSLSHHSLGLTNSNLSLTHKPVDLPQIKSKPEQHPKVIKNELDLKHHSKLLKEGLPAIRKKRQNKFNHHLTLLDTYIENPTNRVHLLKRILDETPLVEPNSDEVGPVEANINRSASYLKNIIHNKNKLKIFHNTEYDGEIRNWAKSVILEKIKSIDKSKGK